MATKREKQLVILLLKERLQRKINKKVILEDIDLELSVELFCKDVLKLGSKENLFDKFMKENGIKSENLSDFIKEVISYIQKTYIV